MKTKIFTYPFCSYSRKVLLQKPFACRGHFPCQRPLLKNNKTVGEFLNQHTWKSSSANFLTQFGVLWADLINPFTPGNVAVKHILKPVKIVSGATMQYAFWNSYKVQGYTLAEFLVEVCHQALQILTLVQTKKYHLLHLFSDLANKIHTHFQTCPVSNYIICYLD